jgi:hypothetical protein
VRPSEPVVLARAGAMTLSARESRITLVAVAQKRKPAAEAPAGGSVRLRVVLKNVIAADRTPPYDVYLLLDGQSVLAAGATAARIGGLDLFGGAGRGTHAAMATTRWRSRRAKRSRSCRSRQASTCGSCASRSCGVVSPMPMAASSFPPTAIRRASAQSSCCNPDPTRCDDESINRSPPPH